MRRIRIFLAVSLLALTVVPTALALRFADESYNMPTGIVGQAYGKQFAGDGGCGPALPYQYTVVGGKLPPGLSMSFRGQITGTPTQDGSWSFWVDLSDQNPPAEEWCRPSEAQREFTITVVAGAGALPRPSITRLTPPTGEVARPFKLQLAASGGRPGYTWSLGDGTKLPSGVSLDPATGVLSGRPAHAGTFPLKLTVTDTLGFADTVNVQLSVAARLAITSRAVSPAKVGRPYATRLGVRGGVLPRTWSITGGSLPAGIHLGKRGGVFSGTPRKARRSTIVLQVRDALGGVARARLVLTVRP